MKKISLCLFTLALFSCSTSSIKTTNPSKELYEILTQKVQGGAKIRFFEILSEPDEIKMLQNDPDLNNKIEANAIQNSNFVILNMGEKPTAGYTIGIDTIIETDKNIILSVKEISPEPESMVSQIITTPYCVVRVNSKKEIIIK